MLECADIRELLANSLDHELTEAMQDKVNAHVAQCAECRRDEQTLRVTVTSAQLTQPLENAEPWFAERTLGRILDELGSNGDMKEESGDVAGQLGFWDERSGASAR